MCNCVCPIVLIAHTYFLFVRKTKLRHINYLTNNHQCDCPNSYFHLRFRYWVIRPLHWHWHLHLLHVYEVRMTPRQGVKHCTAAAVAVGNQRNFSLFNTNREIIRWKPLKCYFSGVAHPRPLMGVSLIIVVVIVVMMRGSINTYIYMDW